MFEFRTRIYSRVLCNIDGIRFNGLRVHGNTFENGTIGLFFEFLKNTIVFFEIFIEKNNRLNNEWRRTLKSWNAVFYSNTLEKTIYLRGFSYRVSKVKHTYYRFVLVFSRFFKNW